MKLLLLGVAAFSIGCASAGTETPAPAPTAQAQTASPATGLRAYEGTYSLQAPSRVIELRVWVDADNNLNGELVGLGQQTTFRPSTEHKFLHAEADDIWVVFHMENGRATSATMHQRGREISGSRTR